MTWLDRIVSFEHVPPSTLRPHPENWREHPDEQLAMIKRSIDDLGQIMPLICSKRTGHVLNGHGRLQVALDQGVELVAVAWVDVDEEGELSVLASFDSVARMRTVREDRLAGLLDSERVRQATKGMSAFERTSGQLPRERERSRLPLATPRSLPVARNKAWYVYAPHAIASEVHDWLEQRLGGVAGVTVKSDA